MKDEIKEIISYLKNNTFIPDETKRKYKILHRDEVNKLLDYITNLQQKVEQYENPDDLTLFYMWIDEKTKDKMKQLQEENERLKDSLETMTFTAKVKQEAVDSLISRIDKAVEWFDFINEYTENEMCDWFECSKKEILDLYYTLQGKSHEE